MVENIQVTLLSFFSGSSEDVTVEVGTTLQRLLDQGHIPSQTNYSVFVNNQVVEIDYLLRQNDIVCLVPDQVTGSAPTCELRKLRKYLRSLEWTQETATVGDHENWRSPEGLLVQLNPQPRDQKVVDSVSQIKCAKALGMKPQELYEAVA